MNKTKYLILGLLMERPLTGYSIKQIIDTRFKFFWSESYGQIYPQLKKMQKDILIEEIEDINLSRGKKLYKITRFGEMEFKNWLSEKPQKESIRMEMLLKYYFGNYAKNNDLINYLADFKDNHDEDLQLLYRFKAELEKISFEENHQYILQIIELGIAFNKAYIDWSDKTIKKLMEG